MLVNAALRVVVTAFAISTSTMAMASQLTMTDLALRKTQEGSVPARFSETQAKVAHGRSKAINWCTEPLDLKLLGAMQRYLDPETSVVKASVQVLLATKSLIWPSAASRAERTQKLNQTLETGFDKLAEIAEVLGRAGLVEPGFTDNLPNELITTLLLNQSDYDVCDQFHRAIRSKAQVMLSKLKEPRPVDLDPQEKERFIRFLEVLSQPTLVRDPMEDRPLYNLGSTPGAR